MIDPAFFPPFAPVTITALSDGEQEGTECLVLVLSVNETQLDPRDRGQLNFGNQFALIRLDEIISKYK